MTTPLADKIKAIIRQNGPISITDYFALCLADPEYGYYKTREPFGRRGDFITAPEVSQLFGEMIGVFLVQAWQKHLKPQRAIRIAEIGPGRGTMMADILRVISRLAPELYQGATVHMVETSAKLTALQAETLAAHTGKISWHESFDEVPDGFLLLAANEFFDAVPIRQFVRTSTGFCERLVGMDEHGDLAFAAGYGTVDPSLLPMGYREVGLGTIAEVAPARSAIMQMISDRLFANGGTGLFIDYGNLTPGFGDTLQAVLDHRFDPVLANPGLADLTSHVDFAPLAETARARSIHINGMMSQGEFLLGLGIAERAGSLGRDKDAAQQDAIRAAITRLVGANEGEMGALFKVLAVSSPAVELPPFVL
ncbi:class I SAM-dependent methyltransferase [Rhizobium sp. KVB221]|uniref:Class I SAM-dependent methyltransferase n=1 Tax=Rhizobium setariae TaxID=2801340 RepID=A0A937CP36_9HYPH|nr:class I SAM-dependent methyltransferase [Rhizobium setariae]MBL0371963.1 class I SAM-dependent methyltransferase [Rhizobium setariae]